MKLLKHEEWIRSYEKSQAKALNDPTYRLPGPKYDKKIHKGA